MRCLITNGWLGSAQRNLATLTPAQVSAGCALSYAAGGSALPEALGGGLLVARDLLLLPDRA
jgi:hypothetical protein